MTVKATSQKYVCHALDTTVSNLYQIEIATKLERTHRYSIGMFILISSTHETKYIPWNENNLTLWWTVTTEAPS